MSCCTVFTTKPEARHAGQGSLTTDPRHGTKDKCSARENCPGPQDLATAAVLERTWFAARAPSPQAGTGLGALVLNGFGDPAGGFEQVERDVAAQVAALVGPPARPPKQVAENAVAKNIAESGENVVDVRKTPDRGRAGEGGVAKAVVAGALVLVAEDFERLGGLP